MQQGSKVSFPLLNAFGRDSNALELLPEIQMTFLPLPACVTVETAHFWGDENTNFRAEYGKCHHFKAVEGRGDMKTCPVNFESWDICTKWFRGNSSRMSLEIASPGLGLIFWPSQELPSLYFQGFTPVEPVAPLESHDRETNAFKRRQTTFCAHGGYRILFCGLCCRTNKSSASLFSFLYISFL